jgi:hypothetical protein
MGTQGVHMKMVLPWLFLSCQYKRFLSCLCCPSRPSYKKFPHRTLFNSFVPIAQQAGQAAVLGRLSVRMCLWSYRVQSELIEKSRQFPQIHIHNGHWDHKAFCVVTNVFYIQAKHLQQSRKAQPTKDLKTLPFRLVF